jgi:enoyl-CoA hydratase
VSFYVSFYLLLRFETAPSAAWELARGEGGVQVEQGGRQVDKASDFIKVKRAERILHLTIDHPPMNTVSIEIIEELARLVGECDGDPGVRAILLDSVNETPPFAADAGTLLADPSWEAMFNMLRRGQRALTVVEFSSKPIVMAIYDGTCMGGGLELALSCHIRVAGKGTVFSAPEARAGAMPGWGSTQRLVHCFGQAKAIELALTGSEITATEAERLGAVNCVVEGPQGLSKARAIAAGIARMRTKRIRAIMAAMHVPYRNTLAAGKAAELEGSMEIYDPKIFGAAVAALFEQRAMEFVD